MFYEKLEVEVIQWAKDKGILDHGTKLKQAIKTSEEVNELLTAVAEGNEHELQDALGDILVTIIIQAEMNGLTLTSCLASALSVIQKRKGVMINGTFVKNEENV